MNHDPRAREVEVEDDDEVKDEGAVDPLAKLIGEACSRHPKLVKVFSATKPEHWDALGTDLLGAVVHLDVSKLTPKVVERAVAEAVADLEAGARESAARKLLRYKLGDACDGRFDDDDKPSESLKRYSTEPTEPQAPRETEAEALAQLATNNEGAAKLLAMIKDIGNGGRAASS